MVAHTNRWSGCSSCVLAQPRPVSWKRYFDTFDDGLLVLTHAERLLGVTV